MPEIKTKKKKWEKEDLFKAYELYRQGLSDNAVAEALGLTVQTFNKYRKLYPEIEDAKKIAKELHQSQLVGGSLTFREYLFRLLPKRARKTWRRLNRLEKARTPMERIELMLEKRGKTVRQYLFVYTWMASNFNLSLAMRKLNVSKAIFENWRRNDPEFAELVDEVMFHKKNFFENSLMNLVAQGDSAAVMFVNKTANKDRGYSERVDLNLMDGSNQNILPIDDLGLSLEDKKKLLEQIRMFKSRKLVESTQLPEKKETVTSFETANGQ